MVFLVAAQIRYTLRRENACIRVRTEIACNNTFRVVGVARSSPNPHLVAGVSVQVDLFAAKHRRDRLNIVGGVLQQLHVNLLPELSAP